MDASRFDDLIRGLSAASSRRALLRGAGGTALALGVPGISGSVIAKKKKKITFNKFGCVDVGKSCKKASQCCSNICQGKQGKKKCRAHNVLGCKAGEDFCTGNIVQCGTNGRCHRTTGKASYCAKFNDCIQCSKDIECEDTHGVGAACVVCPLCVESNDTTTQCVSAAV